MKTSALIESASKGVAVALLIHLLPHPATRAETGAAPGIDENAATNLQARTTTSAPIILPVAEIRTEMARQVKEAELTIEEADLVKMTAHELDKIRADLPADWDSKKVAEQLYPVVAKQLEAAMTEYRAQLAVAATNLQAEVCADLQTKSPLAFTIRASCTRKGYHYEWTKPAVVETSTWKMEKTVAPELARHLEIDLAPRGVKHKLIIPVAWKGELKLSLQLWFKVWDSVVGDINSAEVTVPVEQRVDTEIGCAVARTYPTPGIRISLSGSDPQPGMKDGTWRLSSGISVKGTNETADYDIPLRAGETRQFTPPSTKSE